MSYILDVLYLNSVERRLGRQITPKDINEFGDLELIFPDGHKEWVTIPSILFPYELLSAPEIVSIEQVYEIETDDIQYSNAS